MLLLGVFRHQYVLKFKIFSNKSEIQKSLKYPYNLIFKKNRCENKKNYIINNDHLKNDDRNNSIFDPP